MGVIIEKITYALPENVITNDELRSTYPDWDFERLEDRTGVYQRSIASEGETALDLVVKACSNLEGELENSFEEIDGLIFCTETPDHHIPSNASLLHGRLDLPTNVFSLDINMGCSGFVYSLEMARCLIEGGQADKILLATGDTYSQFINPGDRATRTLFGDGAAVSIISRSEEPGIIDTTLGSSGKHYDKFMVPAGGARQPASAQTASTYTDKNGNVRSAENITMDGLGVLSFFNATIPAEVKSLLKKHELEVVDIDLFVFHQASRVALASIQRALGISDSQMVISLESIGNLVSASIPVALKMAADQGRLKPKGRIVLCGFGVGLSWGATLIELLETTDL